MRVWIEKGSTEFLCEVLSLGSVVGYFLGGEGTGGMSVMIGIVGSKKMESSSDGIICGY